MYVCMCVRMYVCMYVYIYIYVYAVETAAPGVGPPPLSPHAAFQPLSDPVGCWSRREPKGGSLKGGLHFYDFSQNDVSSFVSTYFAQV